MSSRTLSWVCAAALRNTNLLWVWVHSSCCGSLATANQSGRAEPPGAWVILVPGWHTWGWTAAAPKQSSFPPKGSAGLPYLRPTHNSHWQKSLSAKQTRLNFIGPVVPLLKQMFSRQDTFVSTMDTELHVGSKYHECNCGLSICGPLICGHSNQRPIL